jgi:hypothetical protein
MATSNDNADLRLANLTIGKTYELYLQIQCQVDSTVSPTVYGLIRAKQGATIIGNVTFRTDSNPVDTFISTQGTSYIFVATETTVTVDIEIVGTTVTVRGNNGPAQSFVRLRELSQHTETTKFTP